MRIEQINLETDERILIQVRKHWFILAVQVLSLVVVAIIPPLLYFFIASKLTGIFDVSTYGSFLIFGYTVWLLFIWMGLFNVWTNYYLDVWTITNKRVFTVDQRGFFFRTTASFRLERLQDIIISVNGIIPTLLDYGTLEIQTAGEERNFKQFGLPGPASLKALILSASDNLMKPSENRKA